MSINIQKVEVLSANKQKVNLGKYQGQVLLIVNVASKCGFTKQYSGLEKLQKTYKDQGFQVLGFPCNDFGGQEPGSLDEIKEFCSTNYNATFELFDKVHAKGKTTEPFTTLNQAQPTGDVAWNFEKFLISKTGTVVGRYKSAIEPTDKDLIKAIEAELIK